MSAEAVAATRREARAANASPPTAIPRSRGGIRSGTLRIPLLSKASAVAQRRALPIHAYVGGNGHGKTACMIRDTLPSLVEGRTILSTVPILDPATGLPHRLYVPFEHWDQLNGLRGADLLLDEVSGVANARSSGMPEHIQTAIQQLRKGDNVVRWTAPSFQRADLILREVSQGITLLHGYMRDGAALRARGATVSAWAPNRLFSALTYDGMDLARFQSSSVMDTPGVKKRRPRPKIREWWWGPGCTAFGAYDTLAAVSQVDFKCPIDGGKPRAKVCPGHSDEEIAGYWESRGVTWRPYDVEAAPAD